VDLITKPKEKENEGNYIKHIKISKVGLSEWKLYLWKLWIRQFIRNNGRKTLSKETSNSHQRRETMKQWELKNNSKVELPDGQIATFVRMDGMYAQWELKGKLLIGNYEDFKKTDFGYKVKKR